MVEILPDFNRFEACLTDALAVDAYMSNHDGHIPDYVQEWSEKHLARVISTLKEIGSLREQISQL